MPLLRHRRPTIAGLLVLIAFLAVAFARLRPDPMERQALALARPFVLKEFPDDLPGAFRLEVVKQKGYGVIVYAHRRDGTANPVPIVDITTTSMRLYAANQP